MSSYTRPSSSMTAATNSSLTRGQPLPFRSVSRTGGRTISSLPPKIPTKAGNAGQYIRKNEDTTKTSDTPRKVSIVRRGETPLPSKMTTKSVAKSPASVSGVSASVIITGEPNQKILDNQKAEREAILKREREARLSAIQIASLKTRILAINANNASKSSSSPPVPTRSLTERNPGSGREANEKATAAYYLKNIGKTELEKLLEDMPKVELHNHVCGSISPMTFLRKAEERGYFVNPAERKFFKEAGKDRILVKEFLSLPAHQKALETFVNAMTADISKFHPHSHEGDPLEFFKSFVPGDSLTDTELMTWGEQFETPLREAERQNVAYTEFMKGIWTEPIHEIEPFFNVSSKCPHELIEVFKRCVSTEYLEKNEAMAIISSYEYNAPLQYLFENGHIAKYKEAYTKKVKEADATLTKRFHPKPVPQYRLIGQVFRERVDAELFTNLAGAMSLCNEVPRFRGITVAGEESSIKSIQNVNTLINMMRYLYFRMNEIRIGEPFNKEMAKVKVTVHAGEYKTQFLLSKITLSEMTDNVLLAAEVFDGVGHGTVMSPEALTVLARRKVRLELCPSSSFNILGIKLKEHPVKDWRKNPDVDISINTDDAAVNRTTLTNEYLLYVDAFKPIYEELRSLVRGASEGIFESGESIYVKENGRYLVKPEFQCIFDSTELPTDIDDRIKKSEKAQVQWDLEKRFLVFESDTGKKSRLT